MTGDKYSKILFRIFLKFNVKKYQLFINLWGHCYCINVDLIKRVWICFFLHNRNRKFPTLWFNWDIASSFVNTWAQEDSLNPQWLLTTSMENILLTYGFLLQFSIHEVNFITIDVPIFLSLQQRKVLIWNFKNFLVLLSWQ